jgi:D-amino-acid dehydrogenase
MKVAVIGSGVVGVTTAWELAADGHEVTVFERRGSVAAETSFANAGVVAPGYVTPWAAPGMPGKVLSHLGRQHAPIRIRAPLSVGELSWMWRWWQACGSESAYQANRLSMQRLAGFSRERLHAITRSLRLDYERSEGYLVLLRTAKDLVLAQPGLASLTALHTRFELLDAGACRKVEPGLVDEAPLHSGIYLPDDEVGNCRQFTSLLRGEAQRAGVRFLFHTQVRKVTAGRAPQITHMHAPPGEATAMMNLPAAGTPADARDTVPMAPMPVTEAFNAVVVCAALDSKTLLRPLGLKLPMQAVYGYSITAPLRRFEAHGDLGPRSAVMDEHYKVAITRLGARVRVAGGAEVGGRARPHNAKAVATLYKVLHDWFPGAARLSQAQVWKGARAMLPDGPPVLGASGIEGVWLNLGHGFSGWALACGSARVLADSIGGRTSPIETRGLALERLRG